MKAMKTCNFKTYESASLVKSAQSAVTIYGGSFNWEPESWILQHDDSVSMGCVKCKQQDRLIRWRKFWYLWYTLVPLHNLNS